MSVQPSSQLAGSRFINMCLANWFLHLYVFSLIPLLWAQIRQFYADPMMVAWAEVAFAVGMILPGPFGAYLMERRSRKQVFLKAMIVIGLLPTFGYVNAQRAEWLIALHGIQGMAFGVAQTALGTTLINDLLLSKERNAGDVIYAWAGRLGIPIGIVAGFVILQFTDLSNAYWWVLMACGMSFLLVAQTPVPLKAPVKVPLMTNDRFFLPQSFPLVITMFIAPWTTGRVVGSGIGVADCICLAIGTLIAFFVYLIKHHRIKQNCAVSVGYIMLFFAITLIEGYGIFTTYMAYVLLGLGMGTVSSRHLTRWVTMCEHCQRGTSQNSYMLSWRLAFSLGFLCGSLYEMENVTGDLLLTMVSLLIYWLREMRNRRKGVEL